MWESPACGGRRGRALLLIGILRRGRIVMKLTYYGTSAAEGWPALYCNCESCKTARRLKGKNIRTRSQALVNDDLLIDFPADTYLHVLNYGLDLDRIMDVIITHAHEDHLYIDELANRQPGYIPVRAPQIYNLYGNDTVRQKYEECCRNPYNHDFPTVVAMHELREYEPAQVRNYTVWPMLADHNQNEKCFIYLIRDGEGKTLLYAHDTGYLREDVWDFLKGMNVHLDLVSLDCNHGREESSRNHMGIDCDGRVKQRLLDEGLADGETTFVINHFSHNCRFLSHEEIEEAAKPYGFLVSYDGMSVEV